MREMTGKPPISTGYDNLNSNEIHMLGTLDEILDGAIYSRVKTTDISAGHILLSSVTQSATYRTVNDTEKGVWNGKPDDMDELGDGTLFKKVSYTEIDAGRISLTAANYYSTKFSGEWYSMGTESGVDIDATKGINIYGVGNALTTRASKTGTVQCYVGADGAIYAGAGAVVLNANGAYVIGSMLFLYNQLASGKGLAIGRQEVLDVAGAISQAMYLAPSGGSPGTYSSINVDQWYGASYVDVASDVATYLYFMTKNTSRAATVEHVFAPTDNLHGLLGDGTHKWKDLYVGTLHADSGAGVTALSALSIDADKDWGAKDITNADVLAGVTLKASSLTSGRVALVGASGQLVDDADLTFSTDTTTATKLVATTRMKIPVGTNMYG